MGNCFAGSLSAKVNENFKAFVKDKGGSLRAR